MSLDKSASIFVRKVFVRTFSEVIRRFRPRENRFFLTLAHFRNYSWPRRDGNHPRVVEIGVICAILLPLEVSRKVYSLVLPSKFLTTIQKTPKDGIKVAGYGTFQSWGLRIFASPCAANRFGGDYGSLNPDSQTASWALKYRARKITNFKRCDRHVLSKQIFSGFGV